MWIAFQANFQIKKVAVGGGTPILVGQFAEGPGLSWELNDAILYNPGRAYGIWRVPSSGGAGTAVTMLQAGESAHAYPEWLSRDRVLLYSTLEASGSGIHRVVAQSLRTGERREIATGAKPHSFDTGHLMYFSGGTGFAVRFDPATLAVSRAPIAVLQGTKQTSVGTPQVAFSLTGALMYVPAGTADPVDTLAWVGSTGVERDTATGGVGLSKFRLAPDGRRVAVAIGGGAAHEEWTISTEGGSEPVWARRTGRLFSRRTGRLFYRQGDAMMMVDITTTPPVTVSRPQRLFERPYKRSVGYWPNFDVTPDGTRLLMVKTSATEPSTRINVVLNWTSDLQRLVAVP